MMEPVEHFARAPYYDGRGFPVDALSPAEFENFVFGCLLCIQDVLGLKLTGKPSGSGDGGFDLLGQVTSTKRLACVQCKRQKDPLGASQAAEELAKVAATMALESSDVGEHRFICTGGVRQELVHQLREKPRQQLALEASERLANAKEGELFSLRERLCQLGVDPREVAKDYVLRLDVLTAWGLEEFDSSLSPRWSDVLQVAERYFRIATVVREYPRAAFDRSGYSAEQRAFRLPVEPRLVDSSLPEGITASSAANPNATPSAPRRSDDALTALETLTPGELALLVGDGGVGKSAVLELVRANLLRAPRDSTLPVIIPLANYSPGSLDRAIHQELGVDHGTWRSLPDRMLLLCDGLNECPSVTVAAFLEEVKPLLKRRRIACVISTREATRHKNIVLPQPPAVCAKVQCITPIGIRRIAEQELSDGTTDAFVSSYRSLADTSGSPLLWTPFSVLIALNLWKRHVTFPKTFGEMIAALLDSRCARDGESAERSPGTEVVLRLAGALAFQCLVVDRRLECPPLDAGRSLRKAKEYCADALGVVDMTDGEAVDLLVRHEFVRATESNQLRFGHQLLAGALAAPVLSRVWREHKASLLETVADDAWVFAGRSVPTDQLEDYLGTIFDSDLMLGARTARELPAEFHVLAQNSIERAIAKESPEIVRVQGLFALARLASPGAIARLRELSNDTRSSTHHAAQCALAATGDVEFLCKLLPTVDRLSSGPAQVSGGEVSVWNSAPFSSRLDVARRRLSTCVRGDPVCESLRLVSYERDPNDGDLIESHLGASSSLTAWQIGIEALREVSPERAKEYVKNALQEAQAPGHKASLMTVAAHAGVEVDLHEAFDCALAELELDGSENFAIHELVVEVLALADLPSDLIALVEESLPTSTEDRQGRLWKIARACPSAIISEYAASRIAAWGTDLGYACNYFIWHPRLMQARREQLIGLCETGLEDERRWYTWDVWRALTLLIELGFSESAATRLSAMVQRLARVNHAASSGDLSALSSLDAAVMNDTPLDHARHSLARFVAQLVPAIAAARRHLSQETLLSLLWFDTHSFGALAPLVEALSDLPDIAIDEVLIQLDEPWTRRSGLLIACARGATPCRVELLASELRQTYDHLAALNLVQKAIESSWSKEVCEMVIKTVSEIPSWTEHDSQYFWDFARFVARKVGPDNQVAINSAASIARTAFARRVLELWRMHAAGSRIGLSHLDADNGATGES